MNVVLIWEMVHSLPTGGTVLATSMVLIGIAAFIAVALKAMAFRKARIGETLPAQRSLTVYHKGQVERAQRQVARDGSGAGQALAIALTDERSSRHEIEGRIDRFLSDRNAKYQHSLGFLDRIVRTAPIIGLLGPLVGMAELFHRLLTTSDAVGPPFFVNCLWLALLTLSAGSGIALLVLKALNSFENRLEAEGRAIGRLMRDALVLVDEKRMAAEKSVAAAGQSGGQTPPVRLVARQSDAQQMRVERKAPGPDTRTAKALEQRRHALAA